MKTKQLNRALFVINTGGNHKPLKRHFKIQEKIMKKRFPFKTIYEIKKEDINKCSHLKKQFKFILYLFILIKYLKIYYILISYF